MKTAEDIIKEKGTDLVCVDEESTIYDALTTMVEKKIGAILVKRNDKIVGIWTERDLMQNSITEGFNPKTAKIKDYMVTDLISTTGEETIYELMDKFLGLRLRHLLIQKDDHYVGMLSSGDAIRATLNEKNRELKELNKILSWEYYENWQWKNQG
jgi:signal-transduction protein with cAMP-binding, CBS, and nucleotidyltransferase domain